MGLFDFVFGRCGGGRDGSSLVNRRSAQRHGLQNKRSGAYARRKHHESYKRVSRRGRFTKRTSASTMPAASTSSAAAATSVVPLPDKRRHDGGASFRRMTDSHAKARRRH